MAIVTFEFTKKIFRTVTSSGEDLWIPPITNFTKMLATSLTSNKTGYFRGKQDPIKITHPDGTVTTVDGEAGGYVTMTYGDWVVEYSGRDYYYLKEDPFAKRYLYYNFRYRFKAVENKLPLKKPTVKDVIDRVLELIEPLVWTKNGEQEGYVKPPRFRFGYKFPEDTEAGKEERELFNQTAPEFTFTRCTLRECLQEIGRYIHGEPRLKKGGVIYYDRYGERKLATYIRNADGTEKSLNQYPYIGKRVKNQLETACTKVESNVDNFVNKLDGKGGTVAEPFRDGALTLRTDTSYMRFEDAEGSMYFPTSFPINEITAFYWMDYKAKAGNPYARYNITKYLFERNIYKTQLSSYDDLYPTSKSYGLYFTQGEKHIKGFFFKHIEATGGALANFAIKNILEEVTGKKLNFSDDDYKTLCFELEYTPIYGARVAHGKQYIGDLLKKPWALSYNQSANTVETRYFGENIKGAVERLGNTEIEYDLVMRNPKNIPKVGQMWDKDYYISSVAGSVLPDRIKITVGLAKNFNRKSAYVGASSYKRYYEVSERMTQERSGLYTDYLVITQRKGKPFSGDCFLSDLALEYVANTFWQSIGLGARYIMDSIEATGYTKKFGKLTTVVLPVISSALGNVMQFSWSYKDNYSAGVQSVYQQTNAGGNKVGGYFGNEVAYCDFHGRMYYQKFKLQASSLLLTSPDEAVNVALALPAVKSEISLSAPIGTMTQEYGAFAGAERYRIVRKDSREELSGSYNIEFVTDMEDIVIGSALARNCPMTRGASENAQAKLYVLQEEINKFSNQPIDLSAANATLVKTYTNGSGDIILHQGEEGSYLEFTGAQSPVNGKAWAIVSGITVGEPYREEDEDGNVTTVIPRSGGEVLIAKNAEVMQGDIIAHFNIVTAHDIFEFMKENQE